MLLPVLRPAIGLLSSWCAYSVIQRKRLNKSVFPTLQILSDVTRYTESSNSGSLEGYRAELDQLLAKLPDCDKAGEAENLVFLAGDDPELSWQDCDAALKVLSNGWVCGVKTTGPAEDSHAYAVFGPQTALDTVAATGLGDLVSTKTFKMEIDEDLERRLAWAKEIQAFSSNSGETDNSPQDQDDETATTTQPTTEEQQLTITPGQYRFCYRDYVNAEEMMAMMWKRKGIEGFLFKPSQVGVLDVIAASDSATSLSCHLTERSKLFGIIPISIEWDGHIETSNETAMVWDTTCMDMGWSGRWGKHFDRPAAAEKFRQEPWVIRGTSSLSSQESDKDRDNILCLDRRGIGHLVFAEKGAFAPPRQKRRWLRRPSFLRRSKGQQEDKEA